MYTMKKLIVRKQRYTNKHFIDFFGNIGFFFNRNLVKLYLSVEQTHMAQTLFLQKLNEIVSIMSTRKKKKGNIKLKIHS